jgi:hypothetical protein
MQCFKFCFSSSQLLCLTWLLPSDTTLATNFGEKWWSFYWLLSLILRRKIYICSFLNCLNLTFPLYYIQSFKRYLLHFLNIWANLQSFRTFITAYFSVLNIRNLDHSHHYKEQFFIMGEGGFALWLAFRGLQQFLTFRLLMCTFGRVASSFELC